MNKPYKTVVNIAAGRRRYLELLIPQLLNQEELDLIELFVHTNNLSDISYIKSLAQSHDKIKLVYHPKDKEIKIYNIYTQGGYYEKCNDPNTVYIRMDDDIVFVEPGLVKWLAEKRWNDKEHFLMSPCIINNAIVTNILQENKKIKGPTVQKNCFDLIGWKDPKFAEYLHYYFMKKTPDDFRFDDVELEPQRYSINCISFLGSDIKKYNISIENGNDDEEEMSNHIPKKLGKKNIFVGGKLVCHFSFFTQREYLDNTNLLEDYKKYLNNKYKLGV